MKGFRLAMVETRQIFGTPMCGANEIVGIESISAFQKNVRIRQHEFLLREAGKKKKQKSP